MCASVNEHSHISFGNIFALTEEEILLLTVRSNRCIITEVLNAKLEELMNSKTVLLYFHLIVYTKKKRSKKHFSFSAGSVIELLPSILHSCLSIMSKIYKMVLLSISFFLLSSPPSVFQVGVVHMKCCYLSYTSLR